jgi:hypothetical protein
METLKGLFADKLVEDDREPIVFELPFQNKTVLCGFYPPKRPVAPTRHGRSVASRLLLVVLVIIELVTNEIDDHRNVSCAATGASLIEEETNTVCIV